jgi:hypothetical protein
MHDDMTPEQRAAERERHIEAIMTRTGKTREQVEAFFKLAGHSMGWRTPLTDDELRAAYNEFVDTEAGDC